MTIAKLIKNCPQGFSIFRLNGQWHTEVRSMYGVHKSITKHFPKEKNFLELLENLEEYAYAS